MTDRTRKQGTRRHIFALATRANAMALAASSLSLSLLIFWATIPANAVSSPTSPFAPGSRTFHGAVPPKIVMIHDGQRYCGHLVGFAYDKYKPFAAIPKVDAGNITSIDSKKIVSVRSGSNIAYEIEGNPPSEAQPDSLFVTAYTIQGHPAAILGAGTSGNLTGEGNDDKSKHELRHTYQINLPKGKYVLLSTATWTADEKKQTVNGYVIYGQCIQIV